MHTCYTCPSRGPTSSLSFFSPKIFGLRWSTFFRITLTDEKSGKKQNKKHQVRSSKGHMEDVCNFSRSESQKRRGHSPWNKFGLFNANQLVVVHTINSDLICRTCAPPGTLVVPITQCQRTCISRTVPATLNNANNTAAGHKSQHHVRTISVCIAPGDPRPLSMTQGDSNYDKIKKNDQNQIQKGRKDEPRKIKNKKKCMKTDVPTAT